MIVKNSYLMQILFIYLRKKTNPLQNKTTGKPVALNYQYLLNRCEKKSAIRWKISFIHVMNDHVDEPISSSCRR